MAQFPALPLWTDAYCADTDHLSDAEHGLYLRLLMVMWRSPECRVPNDDEWLARRFRRSVQDIEKQLKPLMQEFCETSGNWVTQKRLRKEWEWCQRKRKANSEAAKSRWNKDNIQSERISERNATAASERNAPITTPTPYKKDIVQIDGEAAKRNSRRINGEIDSSFIEFYAAYPRKQSKQDAIKAYCQVRKAGVLHEKIMEGLDRAKRSDTRFREDKFTPLPASWLRAGGWEDEAATTQDWKKAVFS